MDTNTRTARWSLRTVRRRAFVAAVAAALGLTPVALGQAPTGRAAALLAPRPFGPAESPPLARGAAPDDPDPADGRRPAAAPAWLSRGGSGGVVPAVGTFPTVPPPATVARTSAAAAPTAPSVPPQPALPRVAQASPQTVVVKDEPSLLGRGISKLKSLVGRDPTPTLRAGAAANDLTRPTPLPVAQVPSLPAKEPSTPAAGFQAVTPTGAAVYAGRPAWYWYGYGTTTPGANPIAPAGQYPRGSANWHATTGATPGAVPVPVTAPGRGPVGSDPPTYFPNNPTMVTRAIPSLPPTNPGGGYANAPQPPASAGMPLPRMTPPPGGPVGTPVSRPTAGPAFIPPELPPPAATLPAPTMLPAPTLLPAPTAAPVSLPAPTPAPLPMPRPVGPVAPTLPPLPPALDGLPKPPTVNPAAGTEAAPAANPPAPVVPPPAQPTTLSLPEPDWTTPVSAAPVPAAAVPASGTMLVATKPAAAETAEPAREVAAIPPAAEDTIPNLLPATVTTAAAPTAPAGPVDLLWQTAPDRPQAGVSRWVPAAGYAPPATAQTPPPPAQAPAEPPAPEWQSSRAERPTGVIARGQAEPAPQADPLAQFIRSLIAGRANEVEVRWTGSRRLSVCFQAPNEAEASKLVSDVSRRPELTPYQIDFCVVVK